MLAIFGVSLMITDSNLSCLADLCFGVGDVWMIGATFALAVYTAMGHKKTDEIEDIPFLASTVWLDLTLLAPSAGWIHHGLIWLVLSPMMICSAGHAQHAPPNTTS